MDGVAVLEMFLEVRRGIERGFTGWNSQGKYEKCHGEKSCWFRFIQVPPRRGGLTVPKEIDKARGEEERTRVKSLSSVD